jgi:copper chaperone CopZ
MKFIAQFTMAILFLLAFPIISEAQNNSQADTISKTITVKVKGVTCSSDLKTIATNVEKLSGVTSCKSTKMGATSSFEVIYNPAQIAEKEIYSAIESTGGCENPADRPYKVKK